MSLHINQTINASGYVTDAKYLHGTVADFETSLGFHYGRLRNGFFVAYLLSLPQVDEFELAGYSITPKHRFSEPVDLDVNKLKAMAREAMFSTGNRNLVKIFPAIRHNDAMDLDDQYPFGKGGIPQWNLTRELPFYVFQEVEANHKGLVRLS